MIDPKAKEVVDKFVDAVKELNNLMDELQAFDIHPHLEVKTDSSRNYHKSLSIRSLNQTVKYYEEAAND